MTLHTSASFLCVTCGTQYHTSRSTAPSCCRVCDDARQFVAPEGQSFTSLTQLRADGYRNVFRRAEGEARVWEVFTTPKFGIGQRACIIETPAGNVMWDLIAYLDEDTVERIEAMGGLKMIVISHPHFYTTWADWSITFACPVYMADVDAQVWANRPDHNTAAELRGLTQMHTELLPGLTAIVAGGHFPGSMMLHSAPPNTEHASLFVADTILPVPSSRNPDPAKPGVSSYGFMWSIPNMIPLGPHAILGIWRSLKKFDFVATYGLLPDGHIIREQPEHRMTLKQRVLESAKISVRSEEWKDHEIFSETI